jgi:hypothetical protein
MTHHQRRQDVHHHPHSYRRPAWLLPTSRHPGSRYPSAGLPPPALSCQWLSSLSEQVDTPLSPSQ